MVDVSSDGTPSSFPFYLCLKYTSRSSKRQKGNCVGSRVWAGYE